MTLAGFLRLLREQWIAILVSVLAGLVAATATWFLRPPEYTATLQMYVAAQSTDSAIAAFQGAQLSEQRVTSYVALVTSPRVSKEVVRQLGLGTTPEELTKRITAVARVDTVLIDVVVTGTDARNAADVANAIGAVFPKLAEELERPSSPGGVPPVMVRVVEPAAMPTTPSSTGLPVILAIGLLAGLAVGFAAALVRNILDVSVKSLDQLRAVSQAPNLASIAYNANVPRRPLTVHDEPLSSRAEAFRQLRTNLRFLEVDTPRKVIVVTSSLAGEGKTTTLANLAIALGTARKRVLAIEADLRRPKLADMLGIDRSVGLTSILAGRAHIEQAIQHWSGGVFDVLPTGPIPPNPSELLASQHMAALLRQLRNQYDVVLLDTPPLLPVTDAAAVAPATDGAILLCRFGSTTTVQVTAAVEALRAVSAPVLGTVMTMAPGNAVDSYTSYGVHHSAEPAIVPVGPVSDRPQAHAPTPAAPAPAPNRHHQNGRHLQNGQRHNPPPLRPRVQPPAR